MSRFIFFLCFLLLSSPMLATYGHASSTQYGDTGLISQPTAQTLNEGNICIGLWANCSDGIDTPSSASGDSAVIVPTTITMGLGTFIEAYGSYPNMLFNGDEEASARGFANAGFKIRAFGKRSDNFRLALDLQGRRSISDNPDLDGLTDYVTRFVATLKTENFGFHANAGYALNDSTDVADYDDQILVGGGVEYSLATRLRLISEVSFETERVSGEDSPADVTLGLQYFVTPHLTMNLAGTVAMSDASPDWRVLLGLTTCQGVGTFNRPVAKLVDPEDLIEEQPAEPVKVSKIRALTPLLGKIAISDSPISHLEVPIQNPNQVLMINPSDRLKAPGVQPLGASAISPMGRIAKADKTPLPDSPFPAKVKRQFRFPELTYAFNQWDLSEEGRRSISMVVEELRKDNKFFIVSIEGHTDDVGSDRYNQVLSFKRAVAAATHMVLRDGFDPARIFVKGYGESKPIEDNAKDEGRERNRRVELLILVPEGYEGIDVDSSSQYLQGDGNAMLQKGPPIDPLAIEEAIMEKTGAETARPAGTFSQIDRTEQR
jgi:outer membrane protein OmpA-like peptidoglycan-associated protein